MPAPTLIATAGASDANTYATIAQANAYHEAHIHGGTWREALLERRQMALLTSTRVLDQHMAWAGSATTSTQVLAWPRAGLLTPNGYALDSTTIPALVVQATAELARQLLAEDRTADSEIETKGLTSLTVGSIEMAFSGMTKAKTIPDAVWHLIGIWGEPRQRMSDGPLRLARV